MPCKSWRPHGTLATHPGPRELRSFPRAPDEVAHLLEIVDRPRRFAARLFWRPGPLHQEGRHPGQRGADDVLGVRTSDVKDVRGGETQVADCPLEQGRVRLVPLLLVPRDDEYERETGPLPRAQQCGCVHVRDHPNRHLLLEVPEDSRYLRVCARAPIFIEHRIDASLDITRDLKGLEEILNRFPVNFSEREERIRPDVLAKSVSPEIFG